MKAIAKHLVARGISNSIYYRRRIPTAIRRAYPPKQTHVIECLFTSDPGEAVERRKVIDLRVDAEFSQHARTLKQQQADRAKKRLDKLSDEQLESLANFWVRQVLLTDERRRGAGLDEEEFEEIGSQLQQQRSELGRMLAMGQSAKIFPALNTFTTGKPIPTYGIQAAYRRFVDAYLAGKGKFQAGVEFLGRSLPRISGLESGAPLVRTGESLLTATLRAASGLQESYLFVQGPPGAGKTYTGSHVIVELLKAGKRVAVASNSHKAINNLLEAVESVAAEYKFKFRGAKKSSGGDTRLNGKFIEDVGASSDIVDCIADYQLVAGTAFLLATAGLEGKFD